MRPASFWLARVDQPMTKELVLGPFELSALRDIRNGLARFVEPLRIEFLIAEGLASRRLDGGVVLTDQGLRHLEKSSLTAIRPVSARHSGRTPP